MSLPRYISTQSLAAWLNDGQDKPTWRAQRIQRILQRLGVARTVGRTVVVTPEDLAGQWPEIYELVLEKVAEIPHVDHGLVGRTRDKVTNKWSAKKITQSGAKECTHRSQYRGKTKTTCRICRETLCVHDFAAHLPSTQLTCSRCGHVV